MSPERFLRTSMRRAMLVGRFQPFHNGHLEAIRRVAPEWDELVIGIGSAYESFTRENPFSAGERHEMITEALREAGVRNAQVIPVPDMGRNAVWVAHVASLAPRFATFYTNNPLPASLFRAAGYDVRALPFVERERYEGTAIRALMLAGDDAWQKRVPPAVARVVGEIGGVARMRALEASDARSDARSGAQSGAR